MKDRIRWGFLGCGKVVRTKSGDAFRSVPNSTIEAIMRRDLEAAKASAEYFGAPHWCDSVEELLAMDIDAVYIATPPGLHYEQALACMEAGKPVYLEKPFARNYREARALTEAFEKKGIPLYIGHYRRALPRFLKIKELLERHCIGKVLSVEFQLNRIFSKNEAETTWLYNPVLSGGGKFYDIAPHTIDIINFLFGDITEAEGTAVNYGGECPLENLVTMTFRTEKQVKGSLKFCCVAEEKSDRMLVTGTEGTMEFSVHGKQDLIVRNLEGNVTQEIEIADPVTVEQPMVQTVVEDLLGKGHCLSKAKDVLVTYKVIDQVLDEFYGGREDDFWNRRIPCGKPEDVIN